MNLCIPTLNRYDKLEECVRSALWGKTPPEKIYIIDNGGELNLSEFCDKFPEDEDKLIFWVSSENLGVSKSWNKFLTEVEYPMIISNDDIVFGRYDISNFIKAYNTYTEHVLFHSDSIPQVNMFSCFIVRKRLVNTIGLFDEHFYPAYYEDNDYRYRIKLAGFDEMIMKVSTEMRHSNSSTLANYTNEEMQNHHRTFTANRDYYIRKWGGLPEKETYIKPFDAPF